MARIAPPRGSAWEAIGEELRAAFARRISRLGGLGLTALALALAASLATWSVDDPSLNHATDVPARNLLGAPGAVVADVLMQTLGLASMLLPVPVAVWGLRLMAGQDVDRERARLAAWLAASVLAAGALACLPVPSTWPLPSGLGGLAGDVVLLGLRIALGSTLREFFPVLGAVVLATAACLALLFASTLDIAALVRRRMSAADGSAEFDEDGEAPADRLTLALGALGHAALRTGAAFRRWRRRVRGPALAGAASGRREPILEDEDEDEAGVLAEDLDLVDEDEPPPGRSRAGARGSAGALPRARPRPAPLPPGAVSTKRYERPPVALLKEPKPRTLGSSESPEMLRQNALLLEQVLDDFGVRGEIINARPGPVVTLYELQPAPGIKSSRVIGLADDIARSMSAVAARVATIPGRNAIGIELPNQKRETVWLRELLAAKDFCDTKARLPLCLGKSIGGEPVVADLARMPHLLIAGTTGSGKSVAINTMILSLLYRLTPEECRLIMVDPKMLELSVYDGIPHLLAPVVTDPRKAVVALKWTVREMEERYKKMSKVGVRNIDGYNQRVQQAKAAGEVITRTVQTGFDPETGQAVFESEEMAPDPLPYIVVIVDEMADLMMVAGKDIEGAIQRLAQMARAAGIHLVMATQRPSVDVITGTIKANFPTRISFQVTSKIDSRTILGEQGAEQLLGQGDMLYMMGGGRIVRVHGPFVSDEEVEAVVQHLKLQGAPDYLDAITADDGEEIGLDGPAGAAAGEGGLSESEDLYDQAVAVVLRDRKASTSYIQRRLQIGYNRAASLIERMEKEGIVGAANHAGKREILVEGEA